MLGGEAQHLGAAASLGAAEPGGVAEVEHDGGPEAQGLVEAGGRVVGPRPAGAEGGPARARAVPGAGPGAGDARREPHRGAGLTRDDDRVRGHALQVAGQRGDELSKRALPGVEEPTGEGEAYEGR